MAHDGLSCGPLHATAKQMTNLEGLYATADITWTNIEKVVKVREREGARTEPLCCFWPLLARIRAIAFPMFCLSYSAAGRTKCFKNCKNSSKDGKVISKIKLAYFLPRDALVHSAVLRLHVVRLSVRLSVCLSVCL